MHMIESQSVSGQSEALDVRAGAGWVSRHLLRKGLSKNAVFVYLGYETVRSNRKAGRSIFFRRNTISPSADVVLMMGVLKHVDDDVALLTDISIERVRVPRCSAPCPPSNFSGAHTASS